MQITYDTKVDAMYAKFCDGEFVANLSHRDLARVDIQISLESMR
ncbi:MAG: hypothetical protein SU899_05620 [Chloroflexota bacterium]|nr:hypothetical protein [Chloroflexota bacterium]